MREAVDAGARLGRAEALELAHAASRVVATRRGRVIEFTMTKDRPADAVLAEHLLGPTGNLRAPTLRKGKTLIVGFDEATYQRLL